MAISPHEAPDHASTPQEEEAAILAGEGIESAARGVIRERAERDDLAAISDEIEAIKASVGHIAEASSHYVKRRIAANSTDILAANPIKTALWAAFAGFLVGRLSR